MVELYVRIDHSSQNFREVLLPNIPKFLNALLALSSEQEFLVYLVL